MFVLCSIFHIFLHHELDFLGNKIGIRKDMEIELFLKNALKKIRLKIMAIVPASYLNISVCCIILLEIASGV